MSVKKFAPLEALQLVFAEKAAQNKVAKLKALTKTKEEARQFNKALLELKDEYNRPMFNKIEWIKEGDLLILSTQTLVPTTLEKLLKNKNFKVVDTGNGFEFQFQVSEELAAKQENFSYADIARVVVFQRTDLIHSLLIMDGFSNIELKHLLDPNQTDEKRIALKKQIFKFYNKVALCSTSFNNKRLLQNKLLKVCRITEGTPEYAAIISHLAATTANIDGHLTIEDLQEKRKYVPSEPNIKRYETTPEFESFDELKLPAIIPQWETEEELQQNVGVSDSPNE